MVSQVLSFFIASALGRNFVVEAALFTRSSQRAIDGRSAFNSRDEQGLSSSDDLPFQPQITPALAVAGVILILTGTAYLLVGIKNTRLHVFLSAAYLTSLAVTVLLLHLLNLPISDAVQGAYLVAVTMPGLILGATSLLITDITEGLGCLLGGFCVTMWLLVMKPGGLIDGSASKVIFISILTVAAYALFFNRWTKEYALIALTSFAGATVVILGADCFSRAGLKEFWMYIWALNNGLFPPIIDTYPITRGMKAEIALIFIAFLGGVISQSKAWKAIKQRRKEQAAVLLRDQRQHEQHEEDLGRRLEEGNHRERAHWEAVHRDGQTEQGLVSTTKKNIPESPRIIGLSIVGTKNLGESPVSIGLEPLNSLRGFAQCSIHERAAESPQSVTTDHQTNDNDHKAQEKFQEAGWPVELPSNRHTSSSAMIFPYKIPRKPLSSISTPKGETMAKGVRLSGSTISSDSTGNTVASAAQHDANGARLLSTVSDLELDSTKSPNRLSRKLISKRLSIRSMKASLESEEAFLVPKADPSRTSSQAVTSDPYRDDSYIDSQETGQIEPVERVLNIESEDSVPELATEKESEWLAAKHGSISVPHTGRLPKTSPSHPLHRGISDHPHQDPILSEPLGSVNGPGVDRDGTPQRQRYRSKIKSNGRLAASLMKQFGKSRSRAHSVGAGTEVLTASTVAQLASQASTNITATRTDEWAKQVSAAEGPDVRPLKRAFGSDDDETKRYEQPTVSDMSNEPRPAKLGTEISRALRQGFQPSSQTESEQAQMSRSSSNNSTTSAPDSRRLSSQELGLAACPARSDLRISSSPLPSGALISRSIHRDPLQVFDQTFVESPIDDSSEAVYPSHSVSVREMPHSKSTLLAQRQNRVRNQYSSASWGTSQPSTRSSIIPSHVACRHRDFNYQGYDDDVDNISLSERRSIIQHQRRAASHEMPRLSLDNPFFDSHQPQRSTKPYRCDKREAMLSAWRESLKWDRAATTDLETTVEGRRIELFLEQRQERQQQTMMARHRDGVMTEARRTGELEELHREAMRRMQAQAKTHV